MKSIFLSLLVILALGTQIVSVATSAAPKGYTSINVTAEHSARLSAETDTVCCDEKADKKPITSSCTSDCKFFSVMFSFDFPKINAVHAQSDKYWIAAMPTQHHLRPPIS
ncbi:MAG: hypothetical protein ABJM86_04115 [Hyphomicrobiales bacterium]